ncbi:MAG: formimidoylglutamase [Bacteroidota bacterium]
MDIQVYFSPIVLQNEDSFHSDQLGSIIHSYHQEENFPDVEGMNIALIGVGEERNSVFNHGCGMAPDAIRRQLYSLYKGPNTPKIVDLGNINPGNSVEDTYFAVTLVMAELLQRDIVPVVIGGSQDISWAMYKAYEKLNQVINIAAVDRMFDLGKSEDDLTSEQFLHKMIMSEPNFLFNYTNIGFQTYLVSQMGIELMKKLLFDTYRLGWVRKQIEEVEPMVRNADMMSVDISSVRQSDAPGNCYPRPNGFYAEELCQIARYAGMSDKMTSFGIFEVNPKYDSLEQTAALSAQAIWYFIDGYYARRKDYPMVAKDDYIKYIVSLKTQTYEIIFYKSKKSDRWWMEIPHKLKNKNIERHHLVPCSYNDYLIACNDEVPDRWLQFYSKFQ